MLKQGEGMEKDFFRLLKTLQSISAFLWKIEVRGRLCGRRMSALITMGHFLPFTVAVLSITARVVASVDALLHQVAHLHRTLHLTFLIRWAAPKAAEARRISKRKVISMTSEDDSNNIEVMAQRLAEVALPLSVQEDVGFISQAQALGAMAQIQQRGDRLKHPVPTAPYSAAVPNSTGPRNLTVPNGM
jgi:hypothetical protein